MIKNTVDLCGMQNYLCIIKTVISEKYLPIFFSVTYRVCRGFRLATRVAYFRVDLTSFKPNIIFGGSWGSTEYWLEPKTEPPM